MNLDRRPLRAFFRVSWTVLSVNRLTFNLSSDRDPELTWDGRLIYASWQRRTLNHGATGRVVLLGINVDGTDAAPVVVDPGRRIKHMPCGTTDGLARFR